MPPEFEWSPREMKKFLAAIAIATLLPASAMAQQLTEAQAQQAQLVSQCLVNTADNEVNVLFHNFIVALVDNDAATAQGYLPAIVGQAHDNAIANCNQQDDWFSQPWAGAALGGYLQGMMVEFFNRALELMQSLQLQQPE